MYGTIARIRIQPGRESDLMRLTEQYEDLAVPGHLHSFVYKLDGTPDEYMLVAVFDGRANYRANAESPAQHERYLAMRELLAAEPEWHDGEIIYQGGPGS